MKSFNGYIKNIKTQIPQYLVLRCGMTHLNFSLQKLGRIFNLQKEIIKTGMNHDEVYSDTRKIKKSL